MRNRQILIAGVPKSLLQDPTGNAIVAVDLADPRGAPFRHTLSRKCVG